MSRKSTIKRIRAEIPTIAEDKPKCSGVYLYNIRDKNGELDQNRIGQVYDNGLCQFFPDEQALMDYYNKVGQYCRVKIPDNGREELVNNG